ncbi:MAG: hypothetical protein ACXWYI_02990 [Actinomycetota bacterium]
MGPTRPPRDRRARTRTIVAAACAVVALMLAAGPAVSAGPRPVHLVGTYRPVAVDGDGWGRTDHYLMAGGERFLLQRGGAFPSFAPGARIDVTGALEGSRIRTDRIRPAGTTAGRGSATRSSGTRSVLAILVTWTSPDSVTPASAVHQLEDKNDAWYDDASYGQVRMTADATGWLTIPAPTGCDDGQIMTDALAAATDAGASLDAYDHLLVYFPYTSACSWAGMAYIAWDRLWINGYLDTRVTVHELGHNLGLRHAHSLTCTDAGTPVPWSTSCSRSDYGDPFDAMGGSYWGGVGRFNAAQADLLGWLGGRKTTASGGGGTFEIEPLGQRAPGTQALRLPGMPRDVWIEFRRATGVDNWLGAGATNGVLVHLPADGGGSDILDMTPAADPVDAVLRAGRSWVDPGTGWAIRVDDVRPAAATVTVARPADATPPIFTTLPRVSVATTQVLPKRGDPIELRASWAAEDADDAVTGYDVRVAEDEGAWTTVVTGEPASTASIEARPGHTYAVEVRASDGWGNLSGWAAAPPVALTTASERAAIYDGPWSRRRDTRALGGAYRITTRAKASATLRIDASAIALFARVGPDGGRIRVVIDGKAAGTFSQEAGARAFRTLTFRRSWRHVGTHTIRLVNLASAGHPGFSVDGIALLR